jgi:hypothetical protein
MKTAKLMLTIAFLAFGTMMFSQASPDSPVIKLKLGEALQDRGLVKAIYAQYSLNDILNAAEEGSDVHVATVVYRKNVYKIYATKRQWVKFYLSNDGKAIPHPPDER